MTNEATPVHRRQCEPGVRRRRRSAAPRRIRPPASALLLLAFFVFLSVMAWPASRHHWLALEGDAAIAAIESGRALTEAGFARAMDSRLAALAELEVASTRRDLGQAYLQRRLQRGDTASSAIDDGAQAATALRRALGRAPADHFAWYHLARAETMLGDLEAAPAAFANALSFAPYHPPIRRARARLGLAIWDELDPTIQEKLLLELAGTLRSRR